jgi:hypothetical protein
MATRDLTNEFLELRAVAIRKRNKSNGRLLSSTFNWNVEFCGRLYELPAHVTF